MSKIASVVVAGSGSTAIAVGGAYMLQRNEAGTNSQEKEDPSSSKVVEKPFFENLTKFKSDGKSSKCVNDYFQVFEENDNASSAGSISDAKSKTGSFFKDTVGEQDLYKSCVIISWKKTTYDNSKGEGTFTWLWTFVRGNEGFVTFNVAETSGTQDVDKKLKFTGLVYLLEKGSGENGKGTVQYKKEVEGEDKIVSSNASNNLDSYFPKAGTSLSADSGSYWGFIESADKLGDMCVESSCKTNATQLTPQNIELSGTKNDGEAEIKTGSNDLGWWNSVYTKTDFDLETKLQSFKGIGNKATS